MPIRTKSQIAKANRALGHARQKEAVKLLIKWSNGELEDDDIREREGSGAGEDLLPSPKARKYYPFTWEVKGGKSFNLGRAVAQAYQENRHSTKYPGIAIGRYTHEKGMSSHETDWLVAMKAEVFLDIWARLQSYIGNYPYSK